VTLTLFSPNVGLNDGDSIPGRDSGGIFFFHCVTASKTGSGIRPASYPMVKAAGA